MSEKIVPILAILLAAGVFAFPACADTILLQETGRLTSYGTEHGVVNQITIDDAYMYVSLDGGGFEIRDRVTGAQLSNIRVSPQAYAVQFELRDNYAYIADWTGGLTILDITDKGNPVHLGTWDDWTKDGDKFARGVALSGDRCFLSICDYGIVTIDISDPSAPVDTGFLPESVDSAGLPHRLASLCLHKQTDRLIAESYRALELYDIGDPDNLSLTASLSSYLCAELDYDPSGGSLFTGYCWTSQTMFRTSNVSDPDNPFHFYTHREPLPEGELHHIKSIDLVGDYLFLADAYRELIVYDYADPLDPERVAYFPLPDDVSSFTGGFAVDGSTAYVGTSGKGMILLDLSPLNAPEPGTLLLAATGALSLMTVLYRRRKLTRLSH